ncbi:MAG: NlpC/P60 family protein [Desulfobacterales bacterium]
MYPIAKHKSGYRFWPFLIIMLYLLLFAAACGRHTKPPPASPTFPEALPAPKIEKIRFTIQVGAFSTSARASAYADQLQAAGLDAYYFVDVDHLYKVRLERFNTRKAALERGMDLQARALIDDFIVVHPRRDMPTTEPSLEPGEGIVHTARRFIGIPYRWGGTSADKGFDCSGLTMTVYRLNGLDLPRTALEQFRAGTPIARKKLQAGDLVFFSTGSTKRISHVGIYSGQGQFIHAPNRGKTIRTTSLANSYFAGRYQGARRYF